VLARATALRRTAALGRQQLAGAGRPWRDIRGVQLGASKRSVAFGPMPPKRGHTAAGPHR